MNEKIKNLKTQTDVDWYVNNEAKRLDVEMELDNSMPYDENADLILDKSKRFSEMAGILYAAEVRWFELEG